MWYIRFVVQVHSKLFSHCPLLPKFTGSSEMRWAVAWVMAKIFVNYRADAKRLRGCQLELQKAKKQAIKISKRDKLLSGAKVAFETVLSWKKKAMKNRKTRALLFSGVGRSIKKGPAQAFTQPPEGRVPTTNPVSARGVAQLGFLGLGLPSRPPLLAQMTYLTLAQSQDSTRPLSRSSTLRSPPRPRSPVS
jgi:hypothetical protein